jgi:dipeptidyl aminopeptidase/acylaminoacyl peptidase
MISHAPGLVSLVVCLLLAVATTASATESHAPGLPAATLDDLLAEDGVADVAVSPSGRYLAIVVRKGITDRLAVMDLQTGEHQVITTVGRKDVGQRFDARMSTAYWKTDERLLFRLEILPAEGVEWKDLRFGGFRRLGTRLFAIDRNGKNRIRMLGENNNFALDLAFDLGTIRSMLPRDPEHILMVTDGEIGRSLFKVNVITGQGEVVERPNKSAWDWWLDLDGRAIVRVEASLGTLRFFRRQSNGDWKQFYSVRRRELEKERVEYDWLGASDDPNKMYVLSRPPGAQRFAIYLYDLANESFGKPVAEHPQYDIFAGTISRDGTKVLRYCYIAHVRICESADPKVNAHMKGVRKFFKDSANVYVVDSAQDNQTLLLYVEGPSDAPAYYEYRLSQKQIEFIGNENTALEEKRMPSATLLEYSARDGKKVHGYLTRPPGGETATQLPLIVMPHGGPESRDFLAFDIFVQTLAARGYAVFQPNFRGSEGFGLEYIESGYGRWGREMQDDITDGVKELIERGVADPKRICIVGASYGGYAALAGATLTPELYRCVVSIAGVTDLAASLRSDRNRYGAKSETYEYWVRQIGDPERDAERIAAVSPLQLVARVQAPILLVHGEDDDVVPFSQSEVLKKALDKSGRRTELIVLEDEGHSGWKRANLRKVLHAMQTFVSARIGPGYGNPTRQ